MTIRRRLVRVPASSANLGPGYDVLAAALSLHLELEVTEAGRVLGRRGWPAGAGRPLEPLRARLRGASSRRWPALRDPQRDPARPRPRLLSAAAIVAGLMAADHLFELGLERERDLRPRRRARGPPRQRRRGALRRLRGLPAARRRARPRPVRLDPPQGVEGVVVIPDEEVPTEQARAAMPAEVPVADAVANVAAASQLVLGIERSDLTLIGRGLADRLHQPHRAAPLPTLDGAARRGAGTWGRSGRRSRAPGRRCCSGASGRTPARSSQALRERVGGWAEVRRTPVHARSAPTSPSCRAEL